MLKQSDVAQALQSSGVQVFNLSMKEIGGMTAVFGTVASAADKQKAEQAIEARLGKISNHIEVQAPAAPMAGTLQGGAAGGKYTVKSGDSLSKIAKAQYGDASAWKRIYEANKDRIKDPDLIQPGWELTIPK